MTRFAIRSTTPGATSLSQARLVRMRHTSGSVRRLMWRLAARSGDGHDDADRGDDHGQDDQVEAAEGGTQDHAADDGADIAFE